MGKTSLSTKVRAAWQIGYMTGRRRGIDRQNSEEVAQETALAYWQAKAKGLVRDTTRFVHRVALNKSIDQRRSEQIPGGRGYAAPSRSPVNDGSIEPRKRVALTESTEPQLTDREPSPCQTLLTKEKLQSLKELIESQLTAQERDVIQRIYFENRPQQDVASCLGLSTSAVNSTCYRAMVKLRKASSQLQSSSYRKRS